MTFDVLARNDLQDGGDSGWKHKFEVYSVCRRCGKGTIFIIELEQYQIEQSVKSKDFWGLAHVLNSSFSILRFISIRDRAAHAPPEHVPDDIAAAFREGATCLSVECFNAATAMFRLCVDLATKPLLPEAGDAEQPQPTNHQRRNLKPRIEWLIENHKLPSDLAELLDNLREDGNDGAHDGTLGRADAEDAMDFAQVLLQRLFTNPARLKLARDRREARRAPQGD